MRLRNNNYLILLAVIITLFVSCKKEEPVKAPAEAPAKVNTNPYSTDSAYGEVKKQLEENPDDVDALYHLADLYDRTALYDKEIETLKRVVELKPDMGYAYFKLGTAHGRLDQNEEAVEAFKKTLQYMPDYPVALNNLGIAYGKLGRYQEEIAVLEKAVEVRPAYAAARYNLGVVYLKTNNRQKAEEQQKALTEIDEGLAGELQKRIKEAG